MKATKRLLFLAVLATFLACDDGITTPPMDLMPPFGGYIWRVTNGSAGYIEKLNPENFSWEEGGYNTPFTTGYNFDAAAGDGRVWVGGALYDEYDDTYDYSIWEVGTSWDDRIRQVGAYGLTYVDGFLWYAYGDEFYRVNPDTKEVEFLYKLGVPNTGFFGLAWDGNYLWGLALRYKKPSYETWYEIWQLDPEDGTKLHSIKAPTDAPRGLTWDGEALWVNDTKTSRLYRVDPKDGSVLGYVQVDPPGRLPPPAPYGLAFEFPSE